MTGVFISRGETQKGEQHVKTQRPEDEEDHVKREAEIGVVLAQAKEHLGPPEAGRGKEGSSCRDFKGILALPTP